MDTKSLTKQVRQFVQDNYKYPDIDEYTAQAVVPLYHENGDRLEIFLSIKDRYQDYYRICDFGATLKRLNQTFQIDTDHKKQILANILASNCATEDNGNIYIQVAPGAIHLGIHHYARLVHQIMSMRFMGNPYNI